MLIKRQFELKCQNINFKNVDFLVENLLKVQATDHRKIQEEIQENLRKLGYEVKLEKKKTVSTLFFIQF